MPSNAQPQNLAIKVNCHMLAPKNAVTGRLLSDEHHDRKHFGRNIKGYLTSTRVTLLPELLSGELRIANAVAFLAERGIPLN
jgi:hypothetical protein